MHCPSQEWFTGINVKTMVASSAYDIDRNKYKVKSGNNLEFWQGKGWMQAQDPYGWFQWYVLFCCVQCSLSLRFVFVIFCCVPRSPQCAALYQRGCWRLKVGGICLTHMH